VIQDHFLIEVAQIVERFGHMKTRAQKLKSTLPVMAGRPLPSWSALCQPSTSLAR
jgi:hypothetical protein